MLRALKDNNQLSNCHEETYKQEITGLRALAVLLVLLYHAFPNSVGKGYVGVDIFFVISGFLIIGSILREVHAGSFNAINFWGRRIKRIMPALILMIAIVTTLSIFMYPPEKIRSFTNEVMAAIFLGSNFHYYRIGTPYFSDEGSDILLHTWSLSVEGQFYILIPILIMALNRFGINSLSSYLQVFIIVLFISFIFRIYSDNPHMIFYLLPFRTWEFIAGGVAAIASYYYPKPEFNFSLIGALLILTGIFINIPIDMEYEVIFAVIGSSFILFDARKINPLSIVAKLNIISMIGKTSYSVYLYHFPILVIFQKYEVMSIAGLQPIVEQTVLVFIIIPLILFISYISWRFVEEPFRS